MEKKINDILLSLGFSYRHKSTCLVDDEKILDEAKTAIMELVEKAAIKKKVELTDYYMPKVTEANLTIISLRKEVEKLKEMI